MPEKRLARTLLDEERLVPEEERWWDDPSLDRDALLSGLARYALARDSRYDRLSEDTAKLSDALDRARSEVAAFRKDFVRRDEVLLPRQVHALRRNTLIMCFGFALLAVVTATLFMVGEVVPKCFFGVSGPHPVACNTIPGYERSSREANERLQEQRTLIEQIPENRTRIEDLQRQVDRLSRKP